MKIVLILILLTLWLVITVFCGMAGFYLGRRYKSNKEQKPRAEPIQPTEEQIRAEKRRKLENENMLNYSGDEQKDIKV